MTLFRSIEIDLKQIDSGKVNKTEGEHLINTAIGRGTRVWDLADLIQNNYLKARAGAQLGYLVHKRLEKLDDRQKELKRLEEADEHYSKFLKALLDLAGTEEGEPQEPWCIQAKDD